jgi:putative oxidoreductase
MKIASTKYSDTGFSFAALILRLGLGLIMMVSHGYDKLQHFAKYSTGFSDPFHLGSRVSLSLDIFAEFFCSCLLVLGYLPGLPVFPLSLPCL